MANPNKVEQLRRLKEEVKETFRQSVELTEKMDKLSVELMELAADMDPVVVWNVLYEPGKKVHVPSGQAYVAGVTCSGAYSATEVVGGSLRLTPTINVRLDDGREIAAPLKSLYIQLADRV